MVHLFTISWDKLQQTIFRKRKNGNFITLRITCLDEEGSVQYFDKVYEEWFGVCTNKIEKMIANILQYFPNTNVRYEMLGRNYKKVLPYFEQRLQSGKFDYQKKPFYKIYISAPIKDVGMFFDKYKISYYNESDWLTRIYIDFCNKYDTRAFYYKWYDVRQDQNTLMDAFQMLPNKIDVPNWKIAAFDLETVPMNGENRIPNGIHPSDQIVIISLIKWNLKLPDESTKHILYLNPCPQQSKQYNFEYDSEIKLLKDFHTLIEDCNILTGYNINNFDFPCLFSRLLWLGMNNILKQYSSKTIGDYIVTTFQNKIVIDMYNYVRIFSSYDLPSFKLDNVAKIKLGGVGKIPVKVQGIHAWYVSGKATRELMSSQNRKQCYDVLKPKNVSESFFGTFGEYVEYCLRDSELVYRLFCKEMALLFLIERANFAAMDVVHALHYGNSRFLLEVIKTYGTILGFFININFFQNSTDGLKFQSMFIGKDKNTYQGALNYCIPEKFYEDISVMDFTSMYPRTLLNSNLCYGTCTILTKKEYLALPTQYLERFTIIPYRNHSEQDFINRPNNNTVFEYPKFDPHRDAFVIIINQQTEAFLPKLVHHFLELRKEHQNLWKQTHNVIHYNAQLCIKILINSLYGIMASKDSPLAYLVIAISIVTLSRYQLLGSYHYLNNRGYKTVYADTDSLLVLKWPVENCDDINLFLNLQHVEIKYEQRMKRLLVLSKKRYIYQSMDSQLHTKGFQKKINDLVQFMSDRILNKVVEIFDLGRKKGDPSEGWILWVDILNAANFECRDPKKYSITRKTKQLEEYKSKNCPAVKMLQKYPEKSGEYIDFTYSRADVSIKNASQWIMDAEECQYVNFEQLFINQKKIFYLLLNIMFWDLPNPEKPCKMILNTMRWKSFVHTELKLFMKTGKRLAILIERGTTYTFQINDHVFKEKIRK